MHEKELQLILFDSTTEWQFYARTEHKMLRDFIFYIYNIH